MLDIVEPTIFPIARDDRFRATDAITTTSYKSIKLWRCESMLDPQTSSHSAPAVKSPINACEIPVRRATMAVWSMNLSAPNSSTNKAHMKEATLKAMISPLAIAGTYSLR